MTDGEMCFRTKEKDCLIFCFCKKRENETQTEKKFEMNRKRC